MCGLKENVSNSNGVNSNKRILAISYEFITVSNSNGVNSN